VFAEIGYRREAIRWRGAGRRTISGVAIVLSGLPGAGKSTVGRLLAPRLGRDFVDADEVAGPFYAEVGWSIERLQNLSAAVGYEAAHLAWEEALVHGLERIVEMYADAVIALGGGHTHVTSPVRFDRVRLALGRVEGVILLRPSPDPDVAVGMLRQRCLLSKGHDWRGQGVDWLERWSNDGRDELLATATIYNGHESATETALRLRSVLQRGPAPGHERASGNLWRDDRT
jgi:hypothetical protein